MENQTTYPSKIMLVGEYGVILGGDALTIPFQKFFARVRSTKKLPSGKEKEVSDSLAYLKKLYLYIKDLPSASFHAPPDLDHFSEHLTQYWLDMSIPIGYGLGSSGAVSAAIYDLFFPSSRSVCIQHQKKDLATIESYFHGKSSGVDPLTCYTGSALHFSANQHINKVAFDPTQIAGGYRFFLLDSRERFDTGPLVKLFLEKMGHMEFETIIRDQYLPLNQKLIETLLGERDADPALLFRIISDFQLNHFKEMIPEKMIDLWIEGQVSNEFYLKLNGSGGGYMLGITHHTSMESLEQRWKSDLLWIG